MKVKIGKYNLENDVECKIIPDGIEIFAEAVDHHGITPDDFPVAHWGFNGNIIIQKG